MNPELLVKMSEDLGYLRGRVDHVCDSTERVETKLDSLEARLRRLEAFKARVLGVVAVISALPAAAVAVFKTKGGQP